MLVTSINIGRPRSLNGKSFRGETGIFKEPVATPVRLDVLGIDGDAVLNERHHGGPDQAVYLYRQEDYDWWSETLQRPIAPGTFGENLTVSGLPSPDLPIGARLEFDQVLLEVTAPRIPCNTLAERMGDARFARAFVRAERPGLYCRVLHTGTLTTGDHFTYSDAPANDVTVLEIFRAAYRKVTAAEIRRFLDAPIDIRTRRAYEEKLRSLDG